MNQEPTLILRARRTHFQVTCARSLIRTLILVGPKPPPHPMILGTLTGVTFRKLRGVDLMGREVTIPAPHQLWRDVPPERWPAIWADALQLATEIELLCQMTNRPYDLTLVPGSSFLVPSCSHQEPGTKNHELTSCPNEPSPPSPASEPS